MTTISICSITRVSSRPRHSTWPYRAGPSLSPSSKMPIRPTKIGTNSTTSTRSSFVSQSEPSIALHSPTCTTICLTTYISHGTIHPTWFTSKPRIPISQHSTSILLSTQFHIDTRSRLQNPCLMMTKSLFCLKMSSRYYKRPHSTLTTLPMAFHCCGHLDPST
uniref:Uncharacterized protein n=1 Tax=Cacopsylla melanoneura TaxID=428564 RepID=A0A8D8ZVQ1_9HEMI